MINKINYILLLKMKNLFILLQFKVIPISIFYRQTQFILVGKNQSLIQIFCFIGMAILFSKIDLQFFFYKNKNYFFFKNS